MTIYYSIVINNPLYKKNYITVSLYKKFYILL